MALALLAKDRPDTYLAKEYAPSLPLSLYRGSLSLISTLIFQPFRLHQDINILRLRLNRLRGFLRLVLLTL